MSARDDIEAALGEGLHEMSNGWYRVNAQLDAYRAEVLHEAAEKIREAMDYTPAFGARKVAQISENFGRLRAADLIDPEVQA